MDIGISRDEYAGKNLLVTGGAGFIGSHLVNRLADMDGNVLVVELPGTPLWRLGDVGRFATAYGDISDLERIREIFGSFKPQKVFHLAAYGVDHADGDTTRSIMVNVLGSANVTACAAENGCEVVVALGSCAEYGNCKAPVGEECPLRPINAYGSSKAAATIIMHQMARSRYIKVVTLRPFGVYGEGEERHKVFSNAITTLLGGGALELTPCNQLRDYCHVENLVDAMLLAGHRRAEGGIYNVGSGESHPLRYYIELIHKKIGGGRLLFGALPHRKDELWSPVPDLTKITAKLGWRPAIALDEGLDRTIEWFRHNISHYTEVKNERLQR